MAWAPDKLQYPEQQLKKQTHDGDLSATTIFHIDIYEYLTYTITLLLK